MYPSPELRDLVRCVTYAHRVGAGNLLWMQWEAGWSRQMPGHGSGLIAMTRSFARDFLPHLQKTQPGHVDLVLIEWLLEEGRQQNGGYGFLYPTCGSYEEHFSGCDPRMLRRASNFGKPWSGEGFHCGKGPRYIGRMRRKGQGGAEWLGKPVPWDTEDLRWRTEIPPLSWSDLRYQQRLWNRWWIDQHGRWIGPEITRAQQEFWDKLIQRRRPGKGCGRGRGKDDGCFDEEAHAGQH